MGFGDDWIEQNRRTMEAARLVTVRKTLGEEADLYAAQTKEARAEARQTQSQLQQARQQQAQAQRQASELRRQGETHLEQIREMSGQLYQQAGHIKTLQAEVLRLQEALAAAKQAAQGSQKRDQKVLKAVKAGNLDQLLALSPPLAERYLQMQQAQAARAQDVRHREMEAAVSWAMRDLEKDPEPRFGTLEDRRGLSMTFYVERLHVLHDALCGEHPSLRIREAWRAQLVAEEYQRLRAFMLERIRKSPWTPEVRADIEAQLPPETVEISSRHFSEPKTS